MYEDTVLALLREQAAQCTAAALRRCNEVGVRYGMQLSEGQIAALTAARQEALLAAGRVELGEGVLPKLYDAFCDSPFIQRDAFCATLAALQELFYAFCNELDGALTDDELVEALHAVYHGKAQGSLEYLENLTVSDLLRAQAGETDEEGDDGWLD